MMDKTQKLLDHTGATATPDGHADLIVYSNAKDMEPGQQTEIALPLQNWLDMDCPSQITVTVEPGDLLNTETRQLEMIWADTPEGSSHGGDRVNEWDEAR
jgi:hypothetical protein